MMALIPAMPAVSLCIVAVSLALVATLLQFATASPAAASWCVIT
jgi:hypothetical protein